MTYVEKLEENVEKLEEKVALYEQLFKVKSTVIASLPEWQKHMLSHADQAIYYKVKNSTYGADNDPEIVQLLAPFLSESKQAEWQAGYEACEEAEVGVYMYNKPEQIPSAPLSFSSYLLNLLEINLDG